MWNREQIRQHKKAAKLLISIKDSTFSHIRQNRSISEHDIQQFILQSFEKHGLQSDSYPPIVAFGKNTAVPEHYPRADGKRLEEGDLVMIDIWAKLKEDDAPFADITWVGYRGRSIPKEMNYVFDLVVSAREEAIRCIQDNLKMGIIPTGKAVEAAAFRQIREKGFGKYLNHELGHSLGIKDDHGPKPDWIFERNSSRLKIDQGYTIEPGIYLKGKFGIRCELDFYITSGRKLMITTEKQEGITLLR